MSEKGKLIVQKSKKGYYGQIEINGKRMPVPSFYEFKDTSLNNKECEVDREKGKIRKILINGEELPKKSDSSKINQGKFYKKYPQNILNRDRNTPKANITDSLYIKKTHLPDDTKKALSDTKNIDNFYLKLNKAARFENGKFKFFETNKGKIVYQIKANFPKDIIENIYKRYYNSIKKLNLKLSKELILKPDWRLIVGLGNESVYETSMTLHHIYGIPYIPGSAIKGVVRSYIIAKEFGKDEDNSLDLKNAENRALQDQGFCDIFGNESRQGKIIFFDAFPIKVPKIEPDVMNVHYPDYYGNNKYPADYQNPNPIFFLTVKDSAFLFMIGIKNKNNEIINEGKFKGQNILQVVENYLKEALSEHGIGAKTAVGYGYMNEIEDTAIREEEYK